VHRLPCAGTFVVKKQVKPRRPAMDEPGPLQSGLHGGKIGPPDQDVHILRVPHRGLVHGRHPRRHRIPPDHGVLDTRRPQRRARLDQTLTDVFHGIHHPLQDRRRVGDRGHEQWYAIRRACPHQPPDRGPALHGSTPFAGIPAPDRHDYFAACFPSTFAMSKSMKSAW
jgi:hypothetical protein